LAGISDDPLAIWYSKQRGADEVAAFNDSLVVHMPAAGGDITGLAFLNGTLVVFKETGIFALPGDGFDNSGGGQNFGPTQLISADVGTSSPDLVATTPNGLFFFSAKGWYVLDRGFALRYVGAPVEDYNSDTWNSIVVLTKKHQVRCVSSSRMLYFDYLQNVWSYVTEASVAHSALWNAAGTATYNEHHYCTTSAVKRERAAHGTSVTTSLIYRSPWIRVGDLALGSFRVARIGILGEYRSAHDLKIELFRDYSDTAFQTKTWTVTPTTVGGPEIVEISPSIRKATAFSIRITALAVGLSTPPTGEALKLTGLTFKLAMRKGLHRVAAAQKQ
jgi:hypothetical protein